MLSDIDLMMLSDIDKGMDMISTIVLNADDDYGLEYPVCRSCLSEDPSRRAFMEKHTSIFKRLYFCDFARLFVI